MGMCLALHSVSDKNIEQILESPCLIWRLIAPDDPGMYLESCKSTTKINIFSRIFGKKEEKETLRVPDLEFIEGENIEDDLDKSWQGIHYCLNKTEYDAEPPMDFITLGGETSGDIDVGYGPVRFFRSQTVKEIEKRISNITREQLFGSYNPSEMEKLNIYPNIWEDEGIEGFEYIAEYFESLKSFVANCSKHNIGMAVYIC